MQAMKLLVLVLSKYEKLDKLLTALNDQGIRGATVINSTGMAQVLYSKESDQMFGSLRAFLNPERDDNRTVFMVLDDEKIETVKKTVNKVLGSLDSPGTGIMFVIPVLDFEGIGTV